MPLPHQNAHRVELEQIQGFEYTTLKVIAFGFFLSTYRMDKSRYVKSDAVDRGCSL